MHRGRFGGNARKRKSKLNDHTFQAMITGPAAVVDLQLVTIADVPLGDTTLPLIDDSNVDPVLIGRVPSAYRRALDGAFRAQDYQFGYVQCLNCRSDQAYYLHQADLSTGFTFRCRICRHELTVTAEQQAD